MTVKKGESVELTCQTNADHLEWTKDARAFSQEPRVWIERTERSDSALYSCEFNGIKIRIRIKSFSLF